MYDIGEMKAIGNKLFYAAHEPYTSAALYVTEGTRETTRRLVGGSVAGRTVYMLTEVNGSLYYHNDDGELWRTNGTPGDQVLIGHLSTNIIKIDDVNAEAFILALPSESSLELWWTNPDGPPDRLMAIGTNYYIDLYTPLPHFSTASIGDVFYFVASQHPYGESIWRSDGTASGTYRMISVRGLVTEENMEPGAQVRALTTFNNKLYFSALSSDDIWGWYTALGDDHFMHLAYIPPVIHTVVHNKLMYVFAKPPGQDTDVQLWISDGTVEGTRYVTRFPGAGAADHSIIDNVIYFSTEMGPQLIRTDGTACGTFAVNTGVEYAFPMESLRKNLIFGAFTPSTGMEPFIYRSINTVVPLAGCEASATDVAARSSGILTPYPNPFASEFTLRVNSADQDPISVAVFTTSGFPVETFNDVKANTDYPHIGARWPQGMYVVKVNAMGRISTHLVVKR
jgi:ELWxxDGT repeat protein